MADTTLPTLRRLLRLNEDDSMPEVDFTNAPLDEPAPLDAAPVDDVPLDDFAEPAKDIEVPSITMTDVVAATISLIAGASDASGSARDLVDYHANARVAVKKLVQAGIVTVTNGEYTLSDSGRALGASHGLLDGRDEGAALTAKGKAARARYFS